MGSSIFIVLHANDFQNMHDLTASDWAILIAAVFSVAFFPWLTPPIVLWHRLVGRRNFSGGNGLLEAAS
jgi:hypothetical protein